MVKKYNVKVNGNTYEVEVEEIDSKATESIPTSNLKPTNKEQTTNTPKPQIEPKTEVTKTNQSQSNIDAPMSGLVIDVKVKKGDTVNPGDKLLVLEAMKMENDIVSDINGIVEEIHCKKGDNVETGETLITIT